MKKTRLVAIAIAGAMLLALWGCVAETSSSSASQSTTASSEASSVEAVQEPQEPQAIYPWVVTKRTNTSASGLVSEYAYEYDAAGRLVSITGLQEEMIGYNERGTVRIELSRDAEGRLSGLTSNREHYGDAAIERNSDGRIVRVTREWIEAGRMPNADANVIVNEYAYDDDGALATSQSSSSVEGAVTETLSRTYSAEADAGYDGMATSEGGQPSMYNPPLVEWNDERVMAGNGAGTGAAGEFDAYGNLVSVSVGGADAVTFEYKQIAVEPGEWEPGPLSNPTLRTFAFDELTTVNYASFFPPQLDEEDIARVLEADTIHQEPASAAAEAVPAEEAAPAVAVEPETIETPGYSIAIPAEFSSSYDYTVEEGNLSSVTGFAYHATVTLGADSFEVACITDDWGVQGRYTSLRIGEVPSMPGWSAWVYAPVGGSDPAEFAGLVTVK